MMRRFLPFLQIVGIILLLLLVAGCSGAPREDATPEEVDDADMPAPEEDAAPETPEERRREADLDNNLEDNGEEPVNEEMIIREGTVRLVADEVEEVAGEVRNLTEQYDGYVENSTFQEGENGIFRSAQFKLRVPAESFNALLDDISALARVEKEQISTEDVTEEYVDLNARLEVLEAQEGRLMDMYDEAEDIEDLLAIEEELSRLRQEIESFQGRMNYLERVTAYSTLHVNIGQRVEATPQPENVGEEFLFRFQEGWRIFTSTVVSVTGGLLQVWPFMLILAGVGFLVWKKRRKRKSPENT